MRRLITLIALAAAVAACRQGGDDGAPPDPSGSATPAPTASPTATASAEATSNGARSVAEETDDFLFEYSYPVEAGRIPELATVLDLWLAQRREALAEESAEARREARGDGFPYNKHSYTAEWKVIAELPGWLSLSADVATYGGGAHGDAAIESLVWDKENEQAFDARKLFTSSRALEQALGDRFCDALNRQRAERREEPVDAASDYEFDQCPGVGELEVVVGSSNRRVFDRLTLYAGPSVAGPYAEGAYQVDLPVDRAILDAVKPEYRAAFGARN
ncbi:MAG TPA: DUF4163 domain-containing protein [Croceibacterium sp.]|nr:DUF4163 domain-containing protein [Croceibacterium sp.]